MDWITWKLYAVYHLYCKFRINRLVPGILGVIDAYQKQTKSTGTKYPTLYKAVKTILKKRPQWILESGTGTSTLVLAETALHLIKHNPDYQGQIVSMESIEEWHTMAQKLLPQKYRDIVDIRLGKRQTYEYSMFRGYIHSNIPDEPFDFVFLDGPSYEDDKGSSTCMDAVKVRIDSDKQMISCVVDTRVSSVFMMQQILGLETIRYYPIFRTCSFDMPKIQTCPNLNSRSFLYSLGGKLRVKTSAFLT